MIGYARNRIPQCETTWIGYGGISEPGERPRGALGAKRRKRESEREEAHIDRPNDSPREPVVYNEADEEGAGANEITKRGEERSEPRHAREDGFLTRDRRVGGKKGERERKRYQTASHTAGTRRRRGVQSVTNPAFTRGRQGDNLCGARFVLF